MTYLDGVIEKNKKFGDNPEFSLPQNLIDAYNNKDFGNYTDKTGKVPVCFLTDNDITGGKQWKSSNGCQRKIDWISV